MLCLFFSADHSVLNVESEVKLGHRHARGSEDGYKVIRQNLKEADEIVACFQRFMPTLQKNNCLNFIRDSLKLLIETCALGLDPRHKHSPSFQDSQSHCKAVRPCKRRYCRDFSASRPSRWMVVQRDTVLLLLAQCQGRR